MRRRCNSHINIRNRIRKNGKGVNTGAKGAKRRCIENNAIWFRFSKLLQLIFCNSLLFELHARKEGTHVNYVDIANVRGESYVVIVKNEATLDGHVPKMDAGHNGLFEAWSNFGIRTQRSSGTGFASVIA